MNRFFHILLIASNLLLLASCKAPEQDVDLNVISNGSVKFNISKGYKFLEADAENQIYKYTINLMESTVDFADSAGYTGEGSLISFFLYSDNDFDPAPTLYTIDQYEDYPLFSAGDCKIFLNYNFDADSGRACTVSGGTIDVVNMGATIKIKLALVVDSIGLHGREQSDEMFKGTFMGVLESR